MEKYTFLYLKEHNLPFFPAILALMGIKIVEKLRKKKWKKALFWSEVPYWEGGGNQNGSASFFPKAGYASD